MMDIRLPPADGGAVRRDVGMAKAAMQSITATALLTPVLSA